MKKEDFGSEIILGLVGKFGAGKGLVVDYLKTRGFIASSCSDRIREEIRRQGKEITRETLQEYGGRLRREQGPAVLAIRTYAHLIKQQAKRAVVDAIRALEEAQYLMTLPNFHLIAVDAPAKLRFKRMLQRGNKGDPKTWEEFLSVEKRDLTTGGRDIEGCMKKAEVIIENDSSEQELFQKIDQYLERLGAVE